MKAWELSYTNAISTFSTYHWQIQLEKCQGEVGTSVRDSNFMAAILLIDVREFQKPKSPKTRVVMFTLEWILHALFP